MCGSACGFRPSRGRRHQRMQRVTHRPTDEAADRVKLPLRGAALPSVAHQDDDVLAPGAWPGPFGGVIGRTSGADTQRHLVRSHDRLARSFGRRTRSPGFPLLQGRQHGRMSFLRWAVPMRRADCGVGDSRPRSGRTRGPGGNSRSRPGGGRRGCGSSSSSWGCGRAATVSLISARPAPTGRAAASTWDAPTPTATPSSTALSTPWTASPTGPLPPTSSARSGSAPPAAPAGRSGAARTGYQRLTTALPRGHLLPRLLPDLVGQRRERAGMAAAWSVAAAAGRILNPDARRPVPSAAGPASSRPRRTRRRRSVAARAGCRSRPRVE